ncbi:SDR family oxidoreductase [SAR202 cluster bacterium AC-409-J13_OGT_754m]|nr:SDR family oxidoreductase [SAR202 cluster bacterium AC-409-J13_OGT_754m]
MDLGLKERVAIIGGSSKGLGKAIATSLAKEGTYVTICARTESELRKAEMDIARSATQQHVLAIPADLSQIEDIKRVVRDTYNRFERLDIVVNNTGGPPPGKPSELEDSEWYQALEQNFMSAVRMSKEVIPLMKQQRWGRIINLLSNVVKQPGLDLVLSTSTRLGVVGFSKMLSQELGRFNITVNNILPGLIMTDRITSLYESKGQAEGADPDELLRAVTQSIPARRLGRPEEIGDLVAFIASERAAYLSGQSLSLDGGSLSGIM